MDKLEDEHGDMVHFNFVKSIGQNICPLNLFGNKEPTGDSIYGLTKQGPIYVRASKRLKMWSCDEFCETETEGSRSSATTYIYDSQNIWEECPVSQF